MHLQESSAAHTDTSTPQYIPIHSTLLTGSWTYSHQRTALLLAVMTDLPVAQAADFDTGLHCASCLPPGFAAALLLCAAAGTEPLPPALQRWPQPGWTAGRMRHAGRLAAAAGLLGSRVTAV